jgi:O-antigen biosynthesis protein
VGSNPPDPILALQSPRLVVTGYVADADAYFDRCRVFVAPLRYGAGMKGKIGHALALGLPVVTTSVGAEGMGLVDRQHALIRDDPADFAAAAVELYSDAELWHTLSHNGQELVRERWAPPAMRARLESLLDEVRALIGAPVAARPPSA